MQSDANESFVLLDNAKDISKKREHVLSQYKVPYGIIFLIKLYINFTNICL